MAEIITRRSFLRVLTGIIAAPAVIQAASLMPLRGEPLVTAWREALDAGMFASFPGATWHHGWMDTGVAYIVNSPDMLFVVTDG